MKLNSSLLRDAGALYRSVQSVMDLRFRQHGLKRGQFIFLTRICENPGIHQIDLTVACRVDKGTAAKAVSKLSEKGYVRREADEFDSRAWKLYPTEKGRKLYQQIIREENQEIAICLQDFTPQEKEEAQKLMRRLSSNFESYWLAEKNSQHRTA